MPITALPALVRTATTFRADVDTFFGSQIPTFVTQANALEVNVDAKEVSAAASAGTATTKANESAASATDAAAWALSASQIAAVWVSGTTYAIGDTRWSPINYQNYRRKTAGAGTTDPSLDPTNWAALAAAPTVGVVTATAQTAVAGSHYILTNAALTTVTLPASPASGDTVWVTWVNTRATNIIARNAQTIMGLAEDMTLNASTNGTVQLRFVSNSWRIL